MDRFELFSIAERYLELFNPMSSEKILTIGNILELSQESRLIDFGCGSGEPLALWAEKFGISGVGIDIHEYACDRAKKKMVQRGLSSRIKIVCGKGADYSFEKHSYNVAACIGASFIWGGYEPTVRAMKDAVKPGGRLVIGETYRLKENVPAEYASRHQSTHTEYELLNIARREGFDFEYMVRSSHDDWDTYEAGTWRGFISWLEENPQHPERQEVIDRLHKVQEEYLKYGREYLGWAIYVLHPVNY